MPWKLDGQSNDNNLFERTIATKRLNQVHYVQGGNPDGMPIVLLHDNLTSSRWWEATQEQLAYRYSSFAPDLRGYGQTEYQPVKSIVNFADDLHDFSTTLRLKPFFLVGWGMGGGIAMQYALQHPENVVALCLVNSISPKGHRPPERGEQLEELSRALRTGRESEVALYLRRFYFRSDNFPVGNIGTGANFGAGTNADEAAFNYIVAGSMQARNFNYSEQEGIFHVMRNFDIHKAVNELPMPVFIITSDSSRVIRSDEMREVRQYLANGSHIRDEVSLLRTGHAPMIERSDLFMQALSGYLGRLNFQSVVYASSSQATLKVPGISHQSGGEGVSTFNKVSDIAYENN